MALIEPIVINYKDEKYSLFVPIRDSIPKVLFGRDYKPKAIEISVDEEARETYSQILYDSPFYYLIIELKSHLGLQGQGTTEIAEKDISLEFPSLDLVIHQEISILQEKSPGEFVALHTNLRNHEGIEAEPLEINIIESENSLYSRIQYLSTLGQSIDSSVNSTLDTTLDTILDTTVTTTALSDDLDQSVDESLLIGEEFEFDDLVETEGNISYTAKDKTDSGVIFDSKDSDLSESKYMEMDINDSEHAEIVYFDDDLIHVEDDVFLDNDTTGKDSDSLIDANDLELFVPNNEKSEVVGEIVSDREYLKVSNSASELDGNTFGKRELDSISRSSKKIRV